MKDGNCPKCEAADVVRVPGEKFNLSGVRPNYLPAGLFGRVVVTRFVCCECGYTEEWVEKREALQKLKRQHRRVPTRAEQDDLTDNPYE